MSVLNKYSLFAHGSSVFAIEPWMKTMFSYCKFSSEDIFQPIVNGEKVAMGTKLNYVNKFFI